MNKPRIAWLNGHFLPLDEAKVSVQDRGFLFGDGIYEVTAVLDGRLVDYAPHAERLKRSLGEINLDLPVQYDTLHYLHREIADRNMMREGLIYMQVTRGVAERDFTFPKDVAATLVLFTQEKSLVDNPAAETGIRVKTVADLRWLRCDIKSISLLAPVLAKQAAAEAGCQEAWMLRDGLVTEGASSTAFIVTQAGEIRSRPLSQSVLPGITREAVLQLAAQSGLRFVATAFSPGEAQAAAEAFNTSAGGFVMPVVEIDGMRIGDGTPGRWTRRLREIYIAMARAG